MTLDFPSGRDFGGISVVPFGNTIGARIIGLSLKDQIDTKVISVLRRAISEYCLIAIPEQDIEPSQLVAFANSLGELTIYHREELRHQQHPEIVVLTNRGRDGTLRPDNSGGTQWWHFDGIWQDHAYAATLLQMIQKPSDTGNTEFVDMRAVYEALVESLKAQVDGYAAEHWMNGGLERATDTMVPNWQRAIHPIVRTDALTGKRNLYVSPPHTVQIRELPRSASDDLLRALYAFAERPEFRFEYDWREKDVVIWDNRVLLHKGSSSALEPRVLYRITIEELE